jgi:hypothetical protein
MTAAHTFEIRLSLLIYSKYSIEIFKLEVQKDFQFLKVAEIEARATHVLKNLVRNISNYLTNTSI